MEKDEQARKKREPNKARLLKTFLLSELNKCFTHFPTGTNKLQFVSHVLTRQSFFTAHHSLQLRQYFQ